MIEMNCFSPSNVKRSWASAERTSSLGNFCIRFTRSWFAVVPGAAATSTSSYLEAWPANIDCATFRSNTATVAVPSASTSPNFAMPTTWNAWRGPCAATSMLSPSAK